MKDFKKQNYKLRKDCLEIIKVYGEPLKLSNVKGFSEEGWKSVEEFLAYRRPYRQVYSGHTSANQNNWLMIFAAKDKLTEPNIWQEIEAHAEYLPKK